MQRAILLVALGLTACAQSAVETDYQATMLMLPEGQPEAGRDVFVSFGCAACHAVAWDEGLPAPVAAIAAPELGVDVADVGVGGLATSIVAPSHKVAEKYRRTTGGDVSPMRDYSGEMTIRQLADIVAYLQRQGLESQTKIGQTAPGG